MTGGPVPWIECECPVVPRGDGTISFLTEGEWRAFVRDPRGFLANDL